VDDALKTRGIIYLNVETSLLFATPYQNFWLRAWPLLLYIFIKRCYACSN